MAKRLTEVSQYLANKRSNGMSPSQIARDLGITDRHVLRPSVRFQRTGITRAKMGKPRLCITTSQRRLVASPREASRGSDTHSKEPPKESWYNLYQMLKKGRTVVLSATKSRRRKWVHYERKYSNAIWHTMKDPRFRGFQLVTYLDDASR